MEIFASLWGYTIQAAPYLLLGLAVAGFVHTLTPLDFIKTHLGGKGLWPVFKATLLGIPLPLCSCAVIPTAVQLRKSGVGKGATSSFLISTPESGIDSIAVTYALMDLPMTILRPLAAFATSLFVGLAQSLLPDDKEDFKVSSCCPQSSKSKKNRIFSAMEYGFGNLTDDLALWLGFGLVLGGLLNFFLPPDFFNGLNGFKGKLLVLGMGIPIYICAAASTPIAAALVVKGMSPGTAFILLLVGPATNISNVSVLQNYIGKRGVLLNIAMIAVISFGLSYLVDFLYETFSWPLNFQVTQITKEFHFFNHLCGVFLVFLLAKGIFKTLQIKFKSKPSLFLIFSLFLSCQKEEKNPPSPKPCDQEEKSQDPLLSLQEKGGCQIDSNKEKFQ